MKNKGAISVFLIFIVAALLGGYFGYNKGYKPWQANKELKQEEVKALELLEDYKVKGMVNFNPILPKYVPKGYYLSPKIGPTVNESRFLITYVDSDKMRIDIFEENLTPERKARFFKDQEIFPRPTKELKGGITAYVTDSGEVKGKDRETGIEISMAMVEYSFLIDNIKININSVNGLSLEEIEKIANSMIE